MGNDIIDPAGLTRGQARALRAYAIRTKEQLAELQGFPLPDDGQGADLGDLLVDQSLVPANPVPVPVSHRRLGIRAAPDGSSPFVSDRIGHARNHQRLVDHVDGLGELPLSASLAHRFPATGDQMQEDACVGFAASDVAGFLRGVAMSPWAAYQLARDEEGMPLQTGSYQYYAYRGYFKHGPVEARHYGYQDWLDRKPLTPLLRHAMGHRIGGFVDLIGHAHELGYFERMAKAVLTGQMKPGEPPAPVPVSVALFTSHAMPSVEKTGMFRLPLPGEDRVGGHAMVLVGYRDADAPDNPFGVGYFIARNSWGSWACDNPFGLSGHALIPYDYLADYARLWEAYWVLA